MVSVDSTPAGGTRLPSRWWGLGGVLLVIGIALFYGLGSYPLLDEPNDAQYAEVAREMLESSDWVTPRLNDVVFLNKPPLLYWLIGSSYAAFGVNEFAARSPAVIATLVAAALLYALGRELFGSGTAWIALCVFGSMPSTFFEARHVRPDVLLTGATTGALLAIIIALRSDAGKQRLAFGALQVALAVGVMAKGVLGIVLPGIPIVALLVTERRRDLLTRLANPTSWWLFLALVVPWHMAAAWRNEGFLWDYVVQQKHYLLPALPAFALPIADLLHRWPDLGIGWRRVLRAHLAALVIVLAAAIWVVPAILSADPWLGGALGISTLARVYFAALACGVAVAWMLAGRRPLLVAPLVFGSTMLCAPLLHRGLVAIAPLNSSAPTAAAARAAAPPGAAVVCEAPTEYQICAGLTFYLRRPITLLRPPGFIAPAYLRPHENDLFIARETLVDLWQHGIVVFVSHGSVSSPRPLEGVVPEPFVVLRRDGDRFVITNRAMDSAAPVSP